MAARRILLVDDQRDVTRMLRASLETLGRGHVVVEVPSGEEALLEINNARFDLLITDVHLPGISGLQLVERIRKSNASARAILISGMPVPEIEVQATRLNVTAIFTKPLKTEAFLRAVCDALGEPFPGEDKAQAAEDEAPGISERLLALRADLGALAVFLVDLDGRVLVRAGDVAALDLDRLMPPLMSGFNAGLKITNVLGGLAPSNVQFFDGDEFDLYIANVGMSFGLVIVFDGERGMAQMGPVLRYGRKAEDDLLNTLAAIGVPNEPASRPGTGPLPAPSAPVAAPVSAKDLERAAKKAAGVNPDSFWGDETDGAGADLSPASLSFEQAVKLGLVSGDLQA